MNTKHGKLFMVLLIFMLVAIFSLAARFAYGLPLLDSLKFSLAVFFLFYLPGNLLLSYFEPGVKGIGSRFLLSLGVGAVIVYRRGS